MKFDTRLLTGILLGALIGLNYHGVLTAYAPFLVILALIMGLKLLHH